MTALDVLERADDRCGDAVEALAFGGDQPEVAAQRRRLVLLDEPTGHQDDDNVTRVIDALRAARDAGSTVVVATHDERLLDAASRVFRLAGGRIVA